MEYGIRTETYVLGRGADQWGRLASACEGKWHEGTKTFRHYKNTVLRIPYITGLNEPRTSLCRWPRMVSEEQYLHSIGLAKSRLMNGLERNINARLAKQHSTRTTRTRHGTEFNRSSRLRSTQVRGILYKVVGALESRASEPRRLINENLSNVSCSLRSQMGNKPPRRKLTLCYYVDSTKYSVLRSVLQTRSSGCDALPDWHCQMSSMESRVTLLGDVDWPITWWHSEQLAWRSMVCTKYLGFVAQLWTRLLSRFISRLAHRVYTES